MTRQKVKFTYEDYKSLPASETKRYELLGGELVSLPSPSVYHQRISRNLEFLLWRFVKERELGWVYDAPLFWEAGFQLERTFQGDETLTSPLLPGLEVPLQEVF